MPRYDISSHRLFVAADLAPGAVFSLEREQANYLLNVLRMAEGDGFLAFNGRDGEWRVKIAGGSRKAPTIECVQQERAQTAPGDLWYVFAPLKSARLDYIVQKAVEMGASRLVPATTRFTQVSRINLDRMRANAIEAAEQCGVLNVPEVGDETTLAKLLSAWPDDRRLLFCDEDAEVRDPVAALKAIQAGSKLAVLIGPEGGFDESERRELLALPGAVRLSLGPRILRADTAGVAALALVQAVLGDFSGNS
jgi:16S rRNA (uracil1498-N3)-methyltransferase